MNPDIVLVATLLLLAVGLFASGRLRMDLVALMLIIALMLSGVLSPNEALAGFGDPLVILIAGLFVVGEGLFRTGVAFSVGNWLVGVSGTSEARLLILLMLVVAVLSAFMSNTGAVAIFIPVALNLADKAGISPSRLLLPMAYAGSIGGMLTLIGTPPNLAVSTELQRAGMQPFNFFSFAPIGLLVLAVAIAFMLIAGRWLLRDKTGAGETPHQPTLPELIENYGLAGRAHLLRVGPASPAAGQTLGELQFRSRFGVTVMGVVRAAGRRLSVLPVEVSTRYRAGDMLLMSATEPQVRHLQVAVEGLERVPIEQQYSPLVRQELGLVEVLVNPRSRLVGHTIREARFREDHGLSVLGIQRKGVVLDEDLLDVQLDFGDSLLVGGGWRKIELLQAKQQDVTVLALPRELDEVAPNRARAPWALGIVLGMLVLMTAGWVPSVTAVLLAAAAMVLAGCVSMEEGYRAINWQSVVLIAGMLPMAEALEKTGALDLVVTAMVGALGEAGPLALMAGLFLFTTVFSQFISNTATAVLVAPVALGAAEGLGVSPYPLLMTVALAASTAFATPMASPVNTLVMGPGEYRFTDYVRLGVPLQLLAMAITLLAVPLLFPL